MSKILDNKIEQLKKKNYKPKKGQRFKTIIQKIAYLLKRECLKLNNIIS